VGKIAGFEIVRTLGEGGMGIVYLARDETLQRDLAVKVLRKNMVGSEGRERFIREARACSRINHANIVTVYAAGEHQGDPYMAMELLEGRTLREIISEEAPIEWQRAACWISAILSALQQLHDEGIIHRDLKPENMMVGSDDDIKLMDFGIAHVDSEDQITVDNSMIGTARYMSPEQAMGMPTDARSDIFSIGTILYEILTGENPFDAPHPMAVMFGITNEQHVSLAGREPEIPGELAAIIDKALEKDPAARFSSAGEFDRELSALTESACMDSGALRRAPLWRRITVPAAILIATTAVIVWALTRGPGGDRTTARHHNSLGLKHLEEGNKAGAQVEFRNAVISDPRWEAPWNNLALIELDDGDFDEADSLLGEALARNPEYAEAHYNMGTVRWEKNALEEAEFQLRAAIDSDRSFILAYNNLGSLLIAMRRPVEAAEILDKALSRFDSSPYSGSDGLKASLLKNRGIAARDMGDSDAETWWRRSLEISPGNEEVRRLLESVGAL
jgi:Tfp pilus assembly protein PilF